MTDNDKLHELGKLFIAEPESGECIRDCAEQLDKCQNEESHDGTVDGDLWLATHDFLQAADVYYCAKRAFKNALDK